MEQPSRTWPANNKDYRYGFNGKEKDQNGEWGMTNYDYGFRIYNPAIAKFLSVDPLNTSYPWYTPYQFAGNKPIFAVDIDGLEELAVNDKKEFLRKYPKIEQTFQSDGFDEAVQQAKLILHSEYFINENGSIDYAAIYQAVTAKGLKIEEAEENRNKYIREATKMLKVFDSFYGLQIKKQEDKWIMIQVMHENELKKRKEEVARILERENGRFTLADFGNIVGEIGSGAEVLGYFIILFYGRSDSWRRFNCHRKRFIFCW